MPIMNWKIHAQTVFVFIRKGTKNAKRQQNWKKNKKSWDIFVDEQIIS